MKNGGCFWTSNSAHVENRPTTHNVEKSSKIQTSQGFFGTDTINSQTWTPPKRLCLIHQGILVHVHSFSKPLWCDFFRKENLGELNSLYLFFSEQKKGEVQMIYLLGKMVVSITKHPFKTWLFRVSYPFWRELPRPASPMYQVTSRHSWVDDDWFFWIFPEMYSFCGWYIQMETHLYPYNPWDWCIFTYEFTLKNQPPIIYLRFPTKINQM